MNEEFAISLKTIFDQSSFNSIKQQLAEFKKEYEKGIEVAVSPAKNARRKVAPAVDVAPTTTPEIDAMQAKFDQLMEQMLEIQKQRIISDEDWARFDQLNAEAIQLQDNIEAAKQKLAQSSEEAANLKDNAEKAESRFQQVGLTVISIKNNLRPAVKQVGRMIAALVGVRGLYGSIRKAMGSYLSQNEELQSKLNGAWYALGSLFAPVLEWIINLFVKLVSLVDAFVRSLGFAGVNMGKYGKAAGKARKETKQLASFDEINNLSSNDDSGGGGGGGFNLDKVTDEELQRFKAIATLVAGIAAGIAAWKISSLFAEQLGLLPKQCIGIGLAVAGATVYVLAFIDAWKNGLNWYNLAELIGGMAVAAIGLGIAFGPVAAAVALIVGGIGLVVLGIKEFIETGELSNQACVAIAAGFTAIGIAIAILTGNPLWALIGLLIGVTVPLILKNMDKIKEKIGKLGKSISDFYNKNIKPFVDKVNKIVFDLIENKIPEFLRNLPKIVVEKISEIKQKIIDKINEIKSMVSNKITDIKTTIGNIFSGIVGVVAGIWGLISSGASAGWNGIKNVITGLVDGIKTGISDKFNSIKTSISNAWDNIKTTASNKLTGIKTTISGIWDTVKSNTSKSWDGISSGIGSQLAGIASKIANSGIAQKIKSLFNIQPEIKPIVKMPKIQASQTQNGNVFWTHVGTFTAQAYARGTDFVPNDQLAFLHKGEAVIPKEYNDGIQGAPYMGGSETNNLLRELIDVVDSKEFKAYISQNEIGRTAVKYINNQSRIQGGSIV